MSSGDCWLPGGLFVHYGRRYGVNWKGQDGEVIQTVCMDAPKLPWSPPSLPAGMAVTPKEVVQNLPPKKQTQQELDALKLRQIEGMILQNKAKVATSVTVCIICDKPVPGKRRDRETCSPGCRQRACRGKQLVMAGVRP